MADTNTLLTRRATFGPSTLRDRTVTAVLVSRENGVARRDNSGAYTERLATVPGSWQASDRVPLLDSHNRGSIESILGYADNLRSENGEVVADLHIQNDRALELIRGGLLNAVSIGYSVPADAWVTTRGDKLATRYSIREISLTILPADSGATLRSENPMPDDIAARAAVNQEIRTLTNAAGLPATFADGLIDRAATVEQTRAALFDEITRRNVNIPATQVRGSQSGDDPAVLRTRAATALAHRLGLPGEMPPECREYANGLHVSLRMLGAARNEPGIWTMPVAELVTRALTTGDLPVLLQDTTNRLLMPAYTAALSPLRRLARQSSATDFRDLHRVRISEGPSLIETPEHAEIQAGGFSEADESYRLSTYARLVSVTLQALTNNDLGAFGRTSAALGEAAAQTENALLIALLVSNSGNGPTMSDSHHLFDNANHGNAASSGAAISATTLSAGVLAARKQKGLDGTTPINISPTTLLVPAELETVARQQVATVYPAVADDVSIFQDGFTVAVESRLSDVHRWYLFADPATLPVLEYAYLNGQGPTVDSRAGWEVLGVQLRVIDHFGCGVVDYRGAYTNAGA